MNLKSVGILKYESAKAYDYKLALYIDPEIAKYYRTLIPKWLKSNPQMFPSHISIVRNEIPPNLEFWGKYEGEKLDFEYEPIVKFGKVYCWLDCFCSRLEEIRLELGLPVDSPYTLPPEGGRMCFHITLGNYKELA